MKYQNPDISTMIGQMLMVGLRGYTENDVSSFFESIQGYPIGGVILYDENITTTPPSLHNIRSPKQLTSFTSALQKQSEIPLLIATDQEGGKVNRLKSKYGFPDSKSWAELGKINELKITKENAELTAKILKKNGINVNFSPVLDLSNNSKSFIAQKERCFSKDPKKNAPKSPPTIPITSHGKRALDNFHIESSSSTSEVIPDIICLSSSAVSVITSTTSSIVILPNNFPLLLITGSTVKSYFCIICDTSS